MIRLSEFRCRRGVGDDPNAGRAAQLDRQREEVIYGPSVTMVICIVAIGDELPAASSALLQIYLSPCFNKIGDDQLVVPVAGLASWPFTFTKNSFTPEALETDRSGAGNRNLLVMSQQTAGGLEIETAGGSVSSWPSSAIRKRIDQAN
jgi:hypothetical protein